MERVLEVLLAAYSLKFVLPIFATVTCAIRLRSCASPRLIVTKSLEQWLLPDWWAMN